MKEPKTRFPEFTGEWSQNQLNELTSYVDYRGKTPVKTDSGVFLVTAKNVKDGYIDYGASQEYISEDDYEEVMRRGKPRLGDVLITTEAPCGNVAQVDKVEIALAQRIIKYRGNANIIDNTYLKYCLLAPEFQKSLMMNSSGGTVQGIKGSVLHQQKIMYPCYAEQQKIASLFTELDTLIQSAKKELEGYRELKQGMLQKMFPKNGEKVPEIRFPEFTGDWEQHKLGEVATFINGRAYSQDELLCNGKYKVLRVGNFYTNDSWYYSDMELDEKYYANDGDLLYTWSATFGPHIWHGGKVIYHYHIWKIELSDMLEKRFAVQLLEQDKAKILSDKNGSTMVHITKSGMEQKEVLLPSSVAEQTRIGAYFENLENLIALQQKELDGYKELKKGLLQQMFC